jgi:hypothetical protein
MKKQSQLAPRKVKAYLLLSVNFSLSPPPASVSTS